MWEKETLGAEFSLSEAGDSQVSELKMVVRVTSVG